MTSRLGTGKRLTLFYSVLKNTLDLPWPELVPEVSSRHAGDERKLTYDIKNILDLQYLSLN